MGRVDIVKTSEAGFRLIDYLLSGYKYVVIVDSILGESLGDVVRLDPSELRRSDSRSLHWVGVPELLDFIRGMGFESPHIEIYGIVISSIDVGGDVAIEVREGASRLAYMLRDDIIGYLEGLS
jgi:hydrogenase maturation protease